MTEDGLTGSDLGSDSFGEFVAAALPGLLRFGHLLTGDPREAEDHPLAAVGRPRAARHAARPKRRRSGPGPGQRLGPVAPGAGSATTAPAHGTRAAQLRGPAV